MATRSILKEIKAPILFLLRNPASSTPSRATAPLAQTIQNLLVPFPSQSGFVGQLCLNDRPLQARDLNSTFDGGFRIEVRDKKQPVVVEDDSEQSDSEIDFDESDVPEEWDEIGGENNVSDDEPQED